MQPEYVAPHRLLRRALAVGGDRPRAPPLTAASLFWQAYSRFFRPSCHLRNVRLEKRMSLVSDCDCQGVRHSQMQRWRHRRNPTCARLICQASQEFHPQHKDFCRQRSHLLPCQLKKVRHKLSPSGLRTKCFKGDKQIRRFLAKRGQNHTPGSRPNRPNRAARFWLNSERADDGGGFANPSYRPAGRIVLEPCRRSP